MLLAAAAVLLPAPALADTLIENVNGITLDAEGRPQRFSGLVIGENGKVVRLVTGREAPPAPVKRRKKRGEREAAPANQVTGRIDGKGRTLLPGLIDAHGHVMGVGFQALTLDLSSAKTLQEAQTMIAAYAQANPDRRWIIGSGWNQEIWGLGRFPTAQEIDSVIADRPVWLQRVDGHAGWANSAAMRAAGVTAKSVSPSGGRIEKAGANPSGVFVDAAMALVEKAVPAPSARDRDLALGKAQQILLAQGITAIADMGTSLEDWQTYRRAGDNNRLYLRVLSYAGGVEEMVRIGGGGPSPWLYDDRLKLLGVKLYSDGALGSRGAWLKQPYHDAAGERGLGFHTDAQLRNLMSRAAMDGFQVAVHAIGDQANAQLLDAIDELALTYKGDRRWRIEHAQIVDVADLPRFGRNGVIASMQPVHQTSDRTMAEARMGPNRLGGAYAWASMLKNGARLAFGSDTPVESPNPFPGLAVAFTREDASGQPFGGWRPEERVTREQALAGFTTSAAYASFAEDRIGRLAPGMRADFVLVDRDPLLATPQEVRSTIVYQTWVGGRPMYSRPGGTNDRGAADGR